MVYHPILGEVEIFDENGKVKQELFKETKGKVKIINEFPIKFEIIIIQ